jgi:hypothetical protein
MEILTACLCDSAADYNGKLCILGAFDTIQVRQLPYVHPHCSVAIRMLLKDPDQGSHKIVVGLIDSDGKELLPAGKIGIDFQVPPMPGNAFFISSNVVLNLQGLMLPSASQYSFDVSIDGRIHARIPLQVVRVA